MSVDIPAVNIKAAASPKPRPAAKIKPVMIRGRQAGSSTFQMVCHLEAPSPKLPRVYSGGRSFRAFSVTDTIRGRVRMETDKAPAIRFHWEPVMTMNTR